MIAYTLSALFTIGAVWLAVWLLMTGWVKLLDALGESEWLDDNGLRMVSDSPDACHACWAVGYHHAGCRLSDVA